MKQQIKDIQTYFNLQLSDYDTRKLESILSSLKQVEVREKLVKVEVPVEKIVYQRVIVPATSMTGLEDDPPIELTTSFLRSILREFLPTYKVTLEQVLSGNRIGDHVSKCRTHFCRHIILNYPQCSNNKLAVFFNVDHTSIVHMLYHSNAVVPIPPLKRKTNRRCKKQLH